MKIKEILERNPVIPAIKDNNTFKAALSSHNEIVFVIMSNIIEIENICTELKKQGKIVFIHVDMIDGLNSTNYGVDYIINNIKPDGILTTKSNVVVHAHKNTYPFTAPTMTPLAKYFWKKGYAAMMGRMAIITAAIFMGCPSRNRLSPPDW